MKKQFNAYFSAKNLTFFAVLLALVIVLQCFAGTIRIGPTSITLVLIPIVLAGMLLGIWAATFLGFVFGFIVLMYGVSGADPFTALLLADSPVLTVLICLVKGTAAGAVSAVLYKLVAKRNKYVAVFVAAAAAPLVNTGIFILGALCIGGIFSAAAAEASYSSTIAYLVLGVAGWNFVLEFALNLVLSPALYTVDRVVEKQIVTKKTNKAEAANVTVEQENN